MQNPLNTSILQVQSAQSRGGAVLLLCSAGILLLLLLSVVWLETFAVWQGIVLVLSGLGIFAGWAKLAEPKYFLQTDRAGITYSHRLGYWQLSWQGFLYSGVAHNQQQALGYIGFKVTDMDAFLQQLPLRLAVRLMTEQRALYVEAIRQQCEHGRCVTDLLAETDAFITNKQRYNGIKAAFAYRMQHLARLTGFELLVPVSMTPQQAQQLCRQINQLRQQLIQNTVT